MRANGVVHGTLIALAFRRTLPWPMLLVLAGLLALAARDSHDALALSLGPGAGALLRASLRLDVWSLLFGVAVPIVVWNAAHLGTPRRSEWLAPAPAWPGSATLSFFLGSAGAGLCVTLLAALAAESALGPAPAAWRRERVFATPAGLLLADRPSVRWEEPALANPTPGPVRLRLWTTVAPGSGPAVTAAFSCTTPAGRTEVRSRVNGRTPLELALPSGESAALGGRPWELELARASDGAVLVLPSRALEQLVPVASERQVSLALATRALCLLSAACALALGLSCWMRPVLAVLSVAALALSPWAAEVRQRFAPAGDLPGAWSEITSGLVPQIASWTSLAGTGVLVATGLALHVLGMRARRSDS